MANYVSNTPAFIEAQQYSKFILRTLPIVQLPGVFYRNVSDFPGGSTLNIKSIGTATLQEVEENTALTYNPIETDTVTLTITDYVGDAWYVTDVLRQDGAQIEQLMSARGMEATRAIAQYFESRFYATAYGAQTAANKNTINGFDHRFCGHGTNRTMSEDDLIAMRLAFDKANVPQSGRIAMVDPVVAATFQKKVVLTSQVAQRDAVFMRALTDGFNSEHRFVCNLHGWEVYTSNLLPTVAAGASVDGSASPSTTMVANLFMCLADDNTKPIMSAWRQNPKVETERNKDLQRDEFLTTARFGMGAQRLDTLGVIVTDAVAIA